MKVAIVHDWLNQKVGGGERVLLKLAALYPEAPIYTLLYEPKKFGELLPAERIRTSHLQRLPAWLRRHSRYLLPFIPRAIESFDFTGFDVVLSSSVAFSKNIITRPETLHVCYCHAPMRFAWDYWPQYLDEQHLGSWRRWVVTRMVSSLRSWDYLGVARVDRWLANSKTTQARIKKYYHQESRVIYPPVDTAFFAAAAGTAIQNYYVTLANLTPYKKLDLAIEAFNISGEKLVVIGEGADRKRLEELAKPNIEFTGYLSETDRRDKVAGARGLIFPQEEDFGIAIVEATAAATPVIAYTKGGASESVVDGVTGVLFSEQSVEALNRAVERAKTIDFKPAAMAKQAAKFDQAIFAENLTSYVKKAYHEYVHAN